MCHKMGLDHEAKEKQRSQTIAPESDSQQKSFIVSLSLYLSKFLY